MLTFFQYVKTTKAIIRIDNLGNTWQIIKTVIAKTNLFFVHALTFLKIMLKWSKNEHNNRFLIPIEDKC